MTSERVEHLAATASAAGLRLAVAESLTCGLLAATIGKGADAETWFAGGVVAYQTETKHDVLGMDADLDPVSAKAAEQLATGALRLLGADLALSTTGVGGPDPQDGHPAGLVFVGWATEDTCGHHRLQLSGDPARILEGTVSAAVDIAFEALAHRQA